jgi:hypothetical protein
VTSPSRWEREASEATRKVTRRAIRRLDVLEWIILAITAVIAVGGGGLVALLVVGPSAPRFRGVWMVTSLLLLIVPGAVVLARQRKEERNRRAKASGGEEDG